MTAKHFGRHTARNFECLPSMEFQDKQWRNNHAVWQSVGTSIHPSNLQPSSAAQHEGLKSLDKNIRFRTAHLNYPGCSSPKGNEQMVLNFTRTAVLSLSVRPSSIRPPSVCRDQQSRGSDRKGLQRPGDLTAWPLVRSVCGPPDSGTSHCGVRFGVTPSPTRSPVSTQNAVKGEVWEQGGVCKGGCQGRWIGHLEPWSYLDRIDSLRNYTGSTCRTWTWKYRL